VVDDYTCAAVSQALVSDPSIAEVGIAVTCEDDVLILRGTVESDARRLEIERRAAAMVTDHRVRNEITVPDVEPPVTAEEVP
jgi:hypothetical protein